LLRARPHSLSPSVEAGKAINSIFNHVCCSGNMPRAVKQPDYVFALQNSLSAAVLISLFLSQLFAYLLYLNPRSEWLWAWSIGIGRFTLPVLDVYDLVAPTNPVLSCTVLALFSLVPICAQLKRHWLGTSISGHIALGIYVMCLAAAIDRGTYSQDFASRFEAFDPATFDFNERTVAFAGLALIILCALNHVFFFRNMGANGRA
jgi:hypothetical protein